ncbi:MAG: DUF6452 family protein [bacterium]|nr:DUF6452 family protein [bacterium]
MKVFKNIAFISVIGGLIFACNDIPDCQLIEEVEYFQISIYDRDTNTQIDSLIFESIIEPGLGQLLAERDTFHSFILFVNPDDTVTTFYFESDAGFDTLSLSYQSSYRIESDECGPVQMITDLDTLIHTFDSLSIENNELTTDANNIRIFLD